MSIFCKAARFLRKNAPLHLIPSASTSNPSFIVLKRPFKPKQRPIVSEIRAPDYSELRMSNEVINLINSQLASKEIRGRLFAVLQFDDQQFKVTENDLIVVEQGQHFNAGDRIRLRKVLLVGGTNFSLFGTPLIPDETINVEATVVEKTLSETDINFVMIGGKNVRKLKLLRKRLSLLRISKIELLNSLPPVERARDVWKSD